jgi:hypothetical protein
MNNQSKKTYIDLNPTAEKSFQTFLESYKEPFMSEYDSFLKDMGIYKDAPGAPYTGSQWLDDLLRNKWEEYGSPYVNILKKGESVYTDPHSHEEFPNRAAYQKDRSGAYMGKQGEIPQPINPDTLKIFEHNLLHHFLAEMGHAMQYGKMGKSFRDSLNTMAYEQRKKFGEIAYGVAGGDDEEFLRVPMTKELFEKYTKKYPGSIEAFNVDASKYYSGAEEDVFLLEYDPEKMIGEFRPSMEWEAHQLYEPMLYKLIKEKYRKSQEKNNTSLGYPRKVLY